MNALTMGNMPVNNLRYASPNLNMLSNDDLAKMQFAHLADLRAAYEGQQDQNRLAPYEHRAYAREVGAENPLLSPLLAAAAPVYQGVKVFEPKGLSRSQPSFEQLRQGLIGTGEGFMSGIRNYLRQ